MVINTKNRAFTLAEVMIVLLVLTVLLAVFAPFITKRKNSNKNPEEIWRWSTRNYMAGPMDIYYNSDQPVFIGLTPNSSPDIADDDYIFRPAGKVVIRSGFVDNDHVQHQLQFRYGSAGNGNYAGSILADNVNLLIGSQFKQMVPMRSESTYPAGNISFGFEALNQIGEDGADRTDPPLNNIALGLLSSAYLISGDNNVTIGYSAGFSNATSSGNTIVGANAGKKTTGPNNILIGYNSYSVSGNNNTFIGANTGQQPNYDAIENGNFHHNTGIGYEALSKLTSGQYNIAVGAGALKNLQKGNYNVAIGYNACANLVNQSYKTCIGAYSGPASNSPVIADLGLGNDDNLERTYIGSNPNLNADGTWTSRGYYGGDAVLEIHNVGGTDNDLLLNHPNVKSNTTTIINGDLTVYGKTYLTVGNVLYPFYYENNLFGTNTSTDSCAENQTTYGVASTSKM